MANSPLKPPASTFSINGILGDLIEFALMVPPYQDESRHEHHSQVRDFLLDLADCTRAVARELAERRAAFYKGRKGTPAGASVARQAKKARGAGPSAPKPARAVSPRPETSRD